MGNAHLTFDPVTKHLVRNHTRKTYYGNTRTKNLRLGRWHFLTDIPADRARTQCTGTASANGIYAYNSSSMFNSSRMVGSLNNALGYNYVAASSMPGLDFAFYQDYNDFEWNGYAWIVPPVFNWVEYCVATCMRYKLAVPESLRTADIQKVIVDVPSMGLTTGQYVEYCPNVRATWSVERVEYLNGGSSIGYNVSIASSAPARPNSSGQVFGAQIPVSVGTNEMNKSPMVPIRFGEPNSRSCWSNPNDTGGRYVSLDLPDSAIKSLFSGTHVYLMLTPYISSYAFMGTIKPYSGNMYPNTQSVIAYCNNRTSNYGQSMTACWYGGPQLWIYAK